MSCCRRGTSGATGTGGTSQAGDWAPREGFFGTYDSAAEAQAAAAAGGKPGVAVYNTNPGSSSGAWTRDGAGALTLLHKDTVVTTNSALNCLFATKADAQAFVASEGEGTTAAFRDDALGVIGAVVRTTGVLTESNEVALDGTPITPPGDAAYLGVYPSEVDAQAAVTAFVGGEAAIALYQTGTAPSYTTGGWSKDQLDFTRAMGAGVVGPLPLSIDPVEASAIDALDAADNDGDGACYAFTDSVFGLFGLVRNIAGAFDLDSQLYSDSQQDCATYFGVVNTPAKAVTRCSDVDVPVLVLVSAAPSNRRIYVRDTSGTVTELASFSSSVALDADPCLTTQAAAEAAAMGGPNGTLYAWIDNALGTFGGVRNNSGSPETFSANIVV